VLPLAVSVPDCVAVFENGVDAELPERRRDAGREAQEDERSHGRPVEHPSVSTTFFEEGPG
jgi:hypothetical protein